MQGPSRSSTLLAGAGAALAGSLVVMSASAAGSWCLGFGALGPLRTGMTPEQALPLADFAGLHRNKAVGDCWYLQHPGKSGFELMVMDGRVVRIELRADSVLRTLSGAHIGSTEDELRALYGDRLDVQPHKYDEKGRTITYRQPGGEFGLRFETSSGRVTAIQSGPWDHLHYVERCG